MPKTDNLEIQNSVDILLAKVINLIPEKKKSEVQELFVAFKQEFPIKSTGERSWTEEQKAAAREAWTIKRSQQKFWIRNEAGKVSEVSGIDKVAKLLKVKVETLHCYLSAGGGSCSVRGQRISKSPLQEMSPAEAWSTEYFTKHGIYPNPADNPFNSTGRY